MSPNLRPALAAVLLAALLATEPAAGQAAEAEAPAAEKAPAAGPAAYMKPLERLATILGSVHYLRKLCGADDADTWRAQMSAILASQRPSDAERRILVAHFNGGYRAFESTYRRCTPAAELAIDRYLDEGAKLSTEIASRYGT